MQSLFASLIIFMTLGITFAQAFVRQLGIEPSYLTIALGAVIFTYLVANRTLFLIVLMAALTILLQSKTIGGRYPMVQSRYDPHHSDHLGHSTLCIRTTWL